MIDYRNMDEVLAAAYAKGPKRIVVAEAEDDQALQAVEQARQKGLAYSPVLIGNETKIRELCTSLSIDTSQYEIMDSVNSTNAALSSVEMVSSGKVDILMKGLLQTSDFLKAVLNPEVGLRTGNILTATMLVQIKNFDRMLILADGAMNPILDLNKRRSIIDSTTKLAHTLGCENPVVALLAAAEKPDPKMPASLDAAQLQKMNEAGEIKGCTVMGPVSMDLAISKNSAAHKSYHHKNAGEADILIFPNIEAANIFYKGLEFLSQSISDAAAVLMGTSKPVVLTSRADSSRAKFNCIAMSVLLS